MRTITPFSAALAFALASIQLTAQTASESGPKTGKAQIVGVVVDT